MTCSSCLRGDLDVRPAILRPGELGGAMDGPASSPFSAGEPQGALLRQPEKCADELHPGDLTRPCAVPVWVGVSFLRFSPDSDRPRRCPASLAHPNNLMFHLLGGGGGTGVGNSGTGVSPQQQAGAA